MLRKDAPIQYTWDLSHIFPSKLDWEKEYSLTKVNIREFADYKGKLSNPELALRLFRLMDYISLSVERIVVYANMLMHTDGSDSDAVALAGRATSLSAQYSAAVSFVRAELSLLTDEQLDFMINSEAFADYAYELARVKANKAHALSEKEEFLLARFSEVTGSFKDIFEKLDSVDLPQPVIKTPEGKVALTHANYSLLLQNKDRNVRKKAFNAYYALYEERINTIAACYAANVKKNNIIADLRGFDSALAASIHADDVPSEVYNMLIREVQDALPDLHAYVDYRRLSLGELHMYDMYVPIVPNVNLGTDFNNAFNIVLTALRPLGEEYRQNLMSMLAERRIDVYENQGKRSGAYSWGAYGSGPYVLLNYVGTTHDIFTIAHELGHAMHSLYSDRALPYSKAGYSIFVAEVASTTNEVLLLKHLLSTTKDASYRKYLLSYYLDMFRTTLFRQTMFAEFELFAHTAAKKGEALTVESLSKHYLKLNKKYYGKGVTHDRPIRLEWARIPHFYSAFYVYKYATGLTAAVTLANSILSGDQSAVTNYFENFLKAGGKKSPYEILRDAGVDLATERPYKVAMSEFSKTLSEFICL